MPELQKIRQQAASAAAQVADIPGDPRGSFKLFDLASGGANSTGPNVASAAELAVTP